MRPPHLRIEEVTFGYEDYRYRTPIKFGGVALDRVTLLNVHCVLGWGERVARGFGSMPLGNVWSFPSRVLTYDDTLAAMKALAERIARITADYQGAGHPIDVTAHPGAGLPPRRRGRVARALIWPSRFPVLAALVCASPFDAALHDAYGKDSRRELLSTPTAPSFMAHDLGHYLGPEFKGERLDQYVSRRAEAANAAVSPGRRARPASRRRT